MIFSRSYAWAIIENEKGGQIYLLFFNLVVLAGQHAENVTSSHCRLSTSCNPARPYDRQTIFASDENYQYYLENLRIWKEAYGCRIYAYCFMTNHVHLIINPAIASAGTIDRQLSIC